MKKLWKTGVLCILCIQLIGFSRPVFASERLPQGELLNEELPRKKIPNGESLNEELLDEEFSHDELLNEELPDDTLPLESFAITSGLSKATESTFDASRTVVGVAEKDTFITIRVYRYDEETQEELELYFYEITVGASGMFTQIVAFKLGENRIEITAVLEERMTVKNAVIKRKNEEIKRELEQGAAIMDLL